MYYLLYLLFLTFLFSKMNYQLLLLIGSVFFSLQMYIGLWWDGSIVGIFSAFAGIYLVLFLFVQNEGTRELFLLVFFGILGLLVASDSSSLLTIGLGLELQAFSGYILINLRGNLRASESALKYFLIGAVATTLYFLGLTFLPSFDLNALSALHSSDVTLGFSLITVAFFFKIGVAPFHLWMPEAYQSASFFALLYLLVLPKILLFFLLKNFLVFSWDHLISIGIFVSSLLGVCFALLQTKIKTFLAYTIIFNNALFLALLWTNTSATFLFLLFSLFCYALNTALTLFALIDLKIYHVSLENFQSLFSLKKSAFFLSFVIIIAFFSNLGLPPLIGFFNKLFIFGGLLDSTFISLALFLILVSVIPAAYYLRIIVSILFQVGAKYQYLSPLSLNQSLLASFFLACVVYFIFIPFMFLSGFAFV